MKTQASMAAAACGMLLSTAALSGQRSGARVEFDHGQHDGRAEPVLPGALRGDHPAGGVRSGERHRQGLRSLSRHGHRTAHCFSRKRLPWQLPTTCSRTISRPMQPRWMPRAPLRCRHRGWVGEAGRHRGGRGGSGRDDRAAHWRRLRAAGVLRASLAGLRGNGSRRRAVHRQAAPACSGATCARLRLRARTSSVPPRRLRSPAVRYARDYWEVQRVGANR